MKKWLPPLALLVGLIALWELIVRVADVPDYLFPAPSAVAAALRDDAGTLGDATLVTAREMLLGYLLAVALGLGLAVALHFSTVLRRALLPLLVLSQTVPTVVLAPVLAILLGYGIGPKLVVVAIVCFFPIVVNAVDGLRATDPELIRMMRTLRATRWSIFRRVELPGALPMIFSGARIAATYAAVGAVFGEWAGSSEGLGFVMLQSQPSLDTELIFASVLILSLLALASVRRGHCCSSACSSPGSGSRRMRRAALALLVLFLAACGGGGGGSDREATLTLDWTPNPDHVGFYYARDSGLFRKDGLDVSIRAPSDPAAPLKLVAAGRSDLAVSYEQEVFFAAAKKLPVVAVASVIGQPLNSFMSIDPSIRSLADLKGHSVGITGVPADYAALASAGLSHDVKVVNVGLQPAAGAALAQGGRRARRVPERRGHRARAAWPHADRHPARPRGRAYLRRARPRRELRPAALEQGVRGHGREVRGHVPPGLRGSQGAPRALARDPREGDRREAFLPRRLDAGDAGAARRRLPERAGVGAVSAPGCTSAAC